MRSWMKYRIWNRSANDIPVGRRLLLPERARTEEQDNEQCSCATSVFVT